MTKRNATAVVIGAGDFIGGEIAKKFAADGFTVLAGVANPMPIEPPDGDRMAVLMPITSPAMSNSGPPELPLLIDASVWM